LGGGCICLVFWDVVFSQMRWKGEDKLRWVPSKRGSFGIKSYYCVMGCHDGFRFPWKSAWRTKVLLMVAFFVWSAALGKILTMENLRKRSVIVVDRCCMSKKKWEFVDHVLIHCEVASAI
jgi:hypothetical protein